MKRLATWKKRKFWSPLWVYSRIQDVRKIALSHWMQNEFSDLFQKIKPHTLCSPSRLQALHEGIRQIESFGIEGDIVECGVARGGSAALLALALGKNPLKRRLWLLDTFAGLPPASQRDPDYSIAKTYTGAFEGTVDEVQNLLSSLEVECPITLLKGLYQETLPTAPIEKIALLHIDCDWYDSVLICLETFYDKVAVGGIIQIDDYGHWEGARAALNDFFENRGISPRLSWIDYEGRKWVK